jgi:hypothetical protein
MTRRGPHLGHLRVAALSCRSLEPLFAGWRLIGARGITSPKTHRKMRISSRPKKYRAIQAGNDGARSMPCANHPRLVSQKPLRALPEPAIKRLLRVAIHRATCPTCQNGSVNPSHLSSRPSGLGLSAFIAAHSAFAQRNARQPDVRFRLSVARLQSTRTRLQTDPDKASVIRSRGRRHPAVGSVLRPAKSWLPCARQCCSVTPIPARAHAAASPIRAKAAGCLLQHQPLD